MKFHDGEQMCDSINRMVKLATYRHFSRDRVWHKIFRKGLFFVAWWLFWQLRGLAKSVQIARELCHLGMVYALAYPPCSG